MSITLDGLSPNKDFRQDNALHLYGIEALAEITNARQTGLFINEQPQVQYSLNFRDQQGNTHYENFKIVTSMLDMHKFADGSKRTILYLPNDPSVFMIR